MDHAGPGEDGNCSSEAHLGRGAVQEKTAEVLGRYGLSQMQLQTAIKQFQEDPKFTAKIKSIEETQAPRIQAVQQLTGGGRSMGLM